MKKVYICSPCRGDYEANLRRARAYCRVAMQRRYLPIAPHLYVPQFLDDRLEDERAAGLAAGLLLLKECQEMWVFGPPSAGMAGEIEVATSLGIPILDGYSHLSMSELEAAILELPKAYEKGGEQQ